MGTRKHPEESPRPPLSFSHYRPALGSPAAPGRGLSPFPRGVPAGRQRRSHPSSRQAVGFADRRGDTRLQHPPRPALPCPAPLRRARCACTLPGAGAGAGDAARSGAVQAPPESKRAVPGAGISKACAEGVCMWAGICYYR